MQNAATAIIKNIIKFAFTDPFIITPIFISIKNINYTIIIFLKAIILSHKAISSVNTVRSDATAEFLLGKKNERDELIREKNERNQLRALRKKEIENDRKVEMLNNNNNDYN